MYFRSRCKNYLYSFLLMTYFTMLLPRLAVREFARPYTTDLARVSLSPRRSPLLSRTVFWYRAAQKAITFLRATKHLLPTVGRHGVLSSRSFLNTRCLRMHECPARVRVGIYIFLRLYASRLGR